jgi:predicted nucleic acid-binding protein
MIFIDSNIPMYLVGKAHPHKIDAQRLLEGCVAAHERMVTDIEVLQEILHRYVSIDRREAIEPAFDVLLSVVDDVFPVDLSIVERAKELVLSIGRLSARDALHVAVMERHQVTRVMSFDADFDVVPGLVRVFQ